MNDWLVALQAHLRLPQLGEVVGMSPLLRNGGRPTHVHGQGAGEHLRVWVHICELTMGTFDTGGMADVDAVVWTR